MPSTKGKKTASPPKDTTSPQVDDIEEEEKEITDTNSNDDEDTDTDITKDEEIEDINDQILELVNKHNATINNTTPPQEVQLNALPPFPSPSKKSTKKSVPIPPLTANTPQNTNTMIARDLSAIRDEIRQEKINGDKKKKSQKVTAQNKSEDVVINIRLSTGQVFEIRPYVDKVFAVLCQGYDEVLHEPCYRYLKDITYNQAVHFNDFLNKYGCVCNDKTNHTITINKILETTLETIPVKAKKYETKYIQYYLKNIGITSVESNMVIGDEDDSDEEDEDDE